jgi:predicted ATPase
MLLVLDNCEHLIDACAELADRLIRRGCRRGAVAVRGGRRGTGSARFAVT